MIEASGIGVRAGPRWLLQGVSLRMAPGSFTAILGPNGAGKTTLLRALAGGRTEAGSVTLDGAPIAGLGAAALARRRAVLAQHSAAAPGLSVADTVAIGRLAFRHGPGQRDDRAALASVRERFGLEPLWDRAFASLSGGERQRVQIARAAAQLWRPDGSAAGLALFLDEPAAALDLAHQAQAIGFAQDCARRGAAVLAVLHDPNHARGATQIGLLRDGAMLGVGPVAEMLTEARLSTCLGVTLHRAHKADGEAVFVP